MLEWSSLTSFLLVVAELKMNTKYENVAKCRPHCTALSLSKAHYTPNTRFHFRVQIATTDCRPRQLAHGKPRALSSRLIPFET